MFYIQNDSTDPHYNLALEEYVFKYLKPDESFIMLWQNEPSVIIGKNQNTAEEVDGDYVREHGVHVVRRHTGGGAVYHDLGNLNFTFITPADGTGIDFKKFTKPIIQVLQRLGVPAEFNSRNDIAIEGKKFSGNAQLVLNNRVLHHGTIMYDSKLEDVQDVLKVKAEKFKSKSVKSVRSRVTNISEYLPERVSIQRFKDLLLQYLIEEQNEPVQEYVLTDADSAEIRKLMENKYTRWEWNYGRSPRFNFKKSDRFDGGTIEVRLNVVRGTIESSKIYGDFFGVKDIADLEHKLNGERYDEAHVREALQGIDLQPYLGNVTLDEFISCCF